jgi:hypothetical protein
MDPGLLRSVGARRGVWQWLTGPHAIVAVFAAVTAIELLHHEMWLDELNPWDIARDARSFHDLVYNMRFEPHPRLWYVCLYALTRITRNPVAMQMLHGAIATASVALLAYRSPFRPREVWFLAFGYYLVFEYSAISRGYALGILLALASCALASALRPRIVVIAALLALLANASAFGLILALSLAVAIAPLFRACERRHVAMGCAILLIGIGLSMWTLTPSPESVYGRDRHTSWSAAQLDRVGSLLGTAYVPLPNFSSASPWNSSLLITGGRRIPRVGHFTALAIGSMLFVLALVHLRRRPALIAAFVAGSGLMLGLMYVEYSGGYRHHGHLFVLLVLVLWLATIRVGAGPSRLAPYWFTAVLAMHAAAGVYFVTLDYLRPFSASKDLARFFADQPAQVPIVVAQPAFLSYAGPPLSGYLQRKVYYAMPGGVVRGSYLWYDEVHGRGAPDSAIVNEIARFAKDLGTDVYVVVNHWDAPALGTRVTDLPQNLIEGDERTTAVYLFKRPE